MFPSYFQEGAIISTDKDQVAMGYGERVWASQPGSSGEPWFYFPDFFLESNNSWLQYSEFQLIDLKELQQQIKGTKNAKTYAWKQTDDHTYGSEFEKLKTSFRSGLLRKAVPYLFYNSQGCLNIQESLRHLLEHALQHPTFLYGFWSQDEGMLGGTPELLFTIDQSGLLSTAAIAGTTTPDYESSLLSDPKLVEEHALVIEGIKESLATFGQVTVGKTEILSLAHLSHAKTPIQVQLSQLDQIDQIVRAMHPTPALGAYPKDEGRRWLVRYNQLIPRGRYGAPVGVKIGRSFHCYVAIRNMQWHKQNLRIGVGGGVVELSKQADEMEELALKFQATRSMLGV